MSECDTCPKYKVNVLQRIECLEEDNAALRRDCCDMYAILVNGIPAITETEGGYSHESLIIDATSVKPIFDRINNRMKVSKRKDGSHVA